MTLIGGKRKTMAILITGATGFLGDHLTRRVLGEGKHVRVLARSPEKAKSLIAAGAELAAGDVTDADSVSAALQDVTLVYHLAGKLLKPGVPAGEYRRIHVEGTRVLLAQCAKRSTIERIVHCSTTGVLGVTGAKPADEAAPFAPTNIYEQTKLEAELQAREAMQQGLPIVIVRPGLVYGPGDLHLLGFFRAIYRRLFRPIGRVDVWLHPIYIDDMTEAFVHCGANPRASGACFHIAGREPVTIATLADTIAVALGTPKPAGRIPRPAALAVATMGDWLPDRFKDVAPLTRSRLDFLTRSRMYDVSKAKALLGFEAETGLRSGIAQTVAWYRQNGYLPAD
jgi:nucleoside-diphosphate-sugar epimerase